MRSSQIKQKQIINSPERTMLMMELGMLEIRQTMEDVLAIFGMSKAGKTTVAQYAIHNSLVSRKNDFHELVYLLAPDQKMNNAKIGNHPINSQTQIPNIFDYKLTSTSASTSASTSTTTKIIKIADCPGYVDSYGCFRITSNRYFHYKIFSKAKTMRFLIVFSYQDMLTSGNKMIQTFQIFLKGFEGLQDIKDDIINATSVVITKCPTNLTNSQIHQNYKNTKGILNIQISSIYQTLKTCLLKNNRIYTIPSPTKQNEYLPKQNSLIKQIYTNTTGWPRPQTTPNSPNSPTINNSTLLNSTLLNPITTSTDEEREVEMKNININLLSFIEAKGEDRFLEELEELCKYYCENFLKDFQHLLGVVSFFIQDVVDDGVQKVFKRIQGFVDDKRTWREKKSEYKQLYKSYDAKRTKFKQQFFKMTEKQEESSSSAVSPASKSLPMWLLKLKTLHTIFMTLNPYVISHQEAIYTREYVEKASRSVRIILFSIINLIKSAPDTNAANQKKKQDIILEYFYQITKNLEVSNKIFQLMNKNDNTNKKNLKLQDGLKFIIEKYPVSLKNLFITCTGSTPVIEYFHKSITQHSKKISLIPSEISDKGSKIMQKIKQMVINSSESDLQADMKKNLLISLDLYIVNLNNKKFQALRDMVIPNLSFLVEMEKSRLDIVQKIKKANRNAENSEQLQAENNRIIQSMAKCLLKNDRVQEAIQLYDLLFDGYQVIQCFQLLQKRMKAPTIQFLLAYAQKAKKYCRPEAIIKASQAFHLAQEQGNVRKTIQASKLVKFICSGKVNMSGNGSHQAEEIKYMEFLNKEICFVEIPADLCDKILGIAKGRGRSIGR